jgi:hypothetical protein
MPSIVIKSTAFSTTGLVVNSQTFTEDISGLVRVAMTFTTTTAKRDTVSQLFYVDAPPPIFPTSIDSYLLQSEQLYMVDRTVTQSNGLVQISAQYAGALKSSVANPRVSIERQIQGFNFQVAVSEEVDSSTWRAGGPNGFYITVNASSVVYDEYIGTCTTAVKRVSFAQVGGDTIAIENPSISDLILGASISSKSLRDLSFQFTPYPTITAGATDGGAAGSGFTIGGPYYDRGRSAVSLLSDLNIV